ncbi:hypothetical protein OG552_34225 [Streptomyces sp. NBC_01476]|uniref:hypothetical protein n=1 Tax=Streptomyces sp. NBC_01476 TaxID=2903881 RepID=UPI002E367326|nr:hypothetical protein [Streptomyces sp. NBC_01476]
MAKPGSAAASHRFTAPLTPPTVIAPREPEPAAGGEESGSPTDELRTARKYQFTAHDIASGLVAVSRGTSYAQAGEAVRRQAARRWGPPGTPVPSRRHGTLVSDWVEVYAEALWHAQAPYAAAWPETVLVGVLPLTVVPPGRPQSRPGLVFSVFVAMTYEADGRAVVFAIGSAAGTGARHWAAFLRELARARTGRPVRIVGDGSAGLARAVAAVWPRPSAAPEVWTDEAVMRAAARRICRSRGLDGRDVRLWILLQRAWRGPEDWDRFAAEARRYRLPELDRWLATAGPMTARQFAARRPGVHLSRRAVPAALAELETRLGKRRTAFGNQARTDRLLRLMALDIFGMARVHAWTDLICVWLERTGGRPTTSQRRIADRGGRPSLRAAAR